MVYIKLDSLDSEIQSLLKESVTARSFAYCPYSNFAVGAALLCQNGEVFTGCNVENASYGGAICAERTAIVKAVSHGQKDFKAIAVCAQLPDDRIAAPCGICRQFMSEFSTELPVYLSNPSLSNILQTSMGEILPLSFRF